MPETRRETFAATWTLAGVLVLALTAFLIPLAMVVVPEVFLGTYPDGQPIKHNQTAETLVFALSFLILLPLSIWSVPRYAGRFESDEGADALTALATGLVFTFGLLILFVRLSGHLPWGNGIGFGAAAFGAWLVFAAAILVAAPKPGRPRAELARIGAHRRLCWNAAGLGAVLAVASLVVWQNLDVGVVVAGTLVSLALAFAVMRFTGRSLPSVGRGWGRAIDVLVVLLVLLAVPDMIIFPAGPGVDLPNPFISYVVQFHQNLFLGPASQVLDGQVLLVDSVSQYGIGSIYLISAFFKFAPIGHGTLGIFDGVLSAGVIACGYLILRMSGVNRLLAIPTMAIAVVVLAWGLTYPIGGLLQHGAIRYGMPILLIAAMVAGSRWPRSARPMYLVSLFVVALSSVWALEAFLYTLATWVGIVALEAVWAGREGWKRLLTRRSIETVVALAVIQVLFALATLVASGELPDWGLYLTYLKEFLFGDIGDLTYDYSPWSRGLGVGAFYLVATIGLVFTLWKRPDYTKQNRAAFIAITGSLAYGIALYSYLVNRSLDHILPYLLLPFIMIVVIALSLAFREGTPIRRGTAQAALLSSMLVAVFAVSAVATIIPDRASTSMLAYALPGGESLRDGFRRLWNPPPLTPGADEAERLLETEMPGQDRSAVIVEPDLAVESLARADRANSLGFTDPKENGWVPEPNEPIIDAAVDDLEPGDLMLIDERARGFLAAMENDRDGDMEAALDSSGLANLQGEALLDITDRFRLVTVAKGNTVGLEVVRLEPR